MNRAALCLVVLPVSALRLSVLLLTMAGGVAPVRAAETPTKTLADVMLAPESLAPECKPIKGDFGISIQARSHYGTVEKAPALLLKPPAHKTLQSFACGGAKSTIYYYEYASKAELDAALGYTKAFIWGEGGRSEMHPEYILPIENVLVVISSRDAEYFANAFFYGVPGEAGEIFSNALGPFGKKDYASAEAGFRAAIQKSPDLLVGHLYLGHCLFFREKYADAIPEYERATTLAAANGGLTRVNGRILSDQLGMAYALTGRLDDARTSFEAAIKRDPDYPMSYYNLACTFAELGDLDAALASLKAGHARRQNMLPGETYPDPRADDSFKKYLADPRFKAAMTDLGY
ncbi:MAG TPA: tetratricopeptide repeat protein [Dongiaceae bacterium]|nr:tetratricopeptide repeat protein [Dongiaceae bacterium]